VSAVTWRALQVRRGQGAPPLPLGLVGHAPARARDDAWYSFIHSLPWSAAGPSAADGVSNAGKAPHSKKRAGMMRRAPESNPMAAATRARAGAAPTLRAHAGRRGARKLARATSARRPASVWRRCTRGASRRSLLT
jgi:hypothetical protein